ncbi:hypothetical protein QPK87_36480 [Kamptonema cortianum]|jgi:hypothetical protein|nr:hypothetical protein [Kamptonema cortianum]
MVSQDTLMPTFSGGIGVFLPVLSGTTAPPSVEAAAVCEYNRPYPSE